MPEIVVFIIRYSIFAAIHSALAASPVRDKIQKFINISDMHYRLLYNAISTIVFIWVMFAWQSTSVLYMVPGAWSLAMHCAQLISLIFAFICLQQTGIAEFLGFKKPESASGCLVTTGFYSIVRHPIYLASILFMLLNPVMTGRWLALTIMSIIYMVTGALVEERRLLRIFGTKYSEYQKTVPFMIPGTIR